MADDYFDVKLAWDEQARNVVPGATAQVYAIEDTAFATPLEITDMADVPLAALVASSTGIFPPFKVVSGERRVIAVGADVRTPLTSAEGSRGEAGDPGPPGAGADPAGSTVGQVLTSNGPDVAPAWKPAVGGSGITGAPTAWPASFPPQDHTQRLATLRTSTDAALSTAVVDFLSAGNATVARSRIGAAPDTTVSFPGFGTTPDKAAQGTHTHSAAQTAFTPGTIPASTVQDAIDQLATGGIGGGVATRYESPLGSGNYPARGTAAATRVDWVGVEQPTIAAAGSGADFVNTDTAMDGVDVFLRVVL